MTTKNETLIACDPSDLPAIDLQSEACALSEPCECYTIDFPAVAEVGSLLWIPAQNRAGIAWGADASWTDATSPEDALERFASDRMCLTIPSEAETHSTIAAVEAAAVETDQNWDDESTTFIFADGSKLKICGDEWIAS